MSAPRKANSSLAGRPNPAYPKTSHQDSTEPGGYDSNVITEAQGKELPGHNASEGIEPRKVYSAHRPTFFMYGEGSSRQTDIEKSPRIGAGGKVWKPGRGLSPWHGSRTGTIGTWEIRKALPMKDGSYPSRIGNEPNQVFTIMSAGRSALRKSEQLVVPVSRSNVLSSDLHHEDTDRKGAVTTNIRSKRLRPRHRAGVHNLSRYLSTWIEYLSSKTLVVESRMREIRLSGLVRGFPLRDSLCMNVEGGLL